MTDKIELHELSFIPLDKVDTALLEGFSCGNASIDRFLKTHYQATWDHRNALTSTTLVLYQENVVAFFTSCCSQVEIREEERKELGISVSHVPGIEVKYLAVHQDYQGRGIGKTIIENVIGEIYLISQRFACRYIYLWSVPDALDFYEKRFFLDSEITDAEGLHLMMFQVPDHVEFDEDDV